LGNASRFGNNGGFFCDPRSMHQDLETMVASFVTQDQCIKIWKQWWLLLCPKINASRFGNNGGFFCAPRSMHQDLETMVASFVTQDLFFNVESLVKNQCTCTFWFITLFCMFFKVLI
jgi:hypothetical protein